MKNLICIFFLNGFAVASISAQEKDFAWLPGTWKMKDKNVYEIWRVAHDGKTIEGASFKVNGSDTIVMENIKLMFVKNSFYYIPTVAGSQGAVEFKITSRTREGFVAENPAHDFPKLIRYQVVRKQGKEFLEAAIEGDGKKIPYTFQKVQ